MRKSPFGGRPLGRAGTERANRQRAGSWSVATTLRRVSAPADLTIRASLGPQEYSVLVSIWRSAVDATHDFLAEQDRDAIEAQLAESYFPQVTLVVAEHEGRPAGFAGVAQQSLEMLFVDADLRGRGIGSALLAHVARAFGMNAVDVNEQNPSATAFYLSHGFTVAGRSAVDGDGRPYPLLHLRRPPA